jgi:hypothetical protein
VFKVISVVALSFVAVTSAYAAETVQSLASKIVASAAAAEASGSDLAGAINLTIETSGATPVVISGAVNSLLNQCPSGELARELMKRPGSKPPSFCLENAQAALRAQRATALALLGNGATGAITGGAGLPVPPSGASAGPGSDYQP